MGTMTLNQAILFLESPSKGLFPLVDVKFRTFNKRKGTGGKLVEIKRARLIKRNNKKGLNRIVYKDPNHWENMTRNFVLQNKDIVKVNILFIVELNGKKITY